MFVDGGWSIRRRAARDGTQRLPYVAALANADMDICRTDTGAVGAIAGSQGLRAVMVRARALEHVVNWRRRNRL